MPESRDRLVRPVDIAAVFARRGSGPLGILQDQPEPGPNLSQSPPTRVVNATAARGQTIGGGRDGGLRTPRSVFGRGRRNVYGFASATRGTPGRENTPMGSARRGRSVLPAWYPRTPLRDITAVVRAIERGRTRLGAVGGLQVESPMSQDQRVLDSPGPLSGARLEHDASMLTPNPTFSVKRCPPTVGKVPKILLEITNQTGEDLESLTPQKKLLNSIDKIEKVVMEELKKLKRTPSAKKAEREKRVRTLMSLR